MKSGKIISCCVPAFIAAFIFYSMNVHAQDAYAGTVFEDDAGKSDARIPDNNDFYRLPVVFECNTKMFNYKNPSSHFFTGWQDDVNSLLFLGFNEMSRKYFQRDSGTKLSRSLYLAAFTAADLVVNRAFSVTAHDLGHKERALSLGATDVWLADMDTGSRLGVYEFFFQSFDVTKTPGILVYTIPGLTPRDITCVAGAGLNRNLLIASNYARKFVHGEGKVTDIAPYVMNKTWSVFYFFNAGISTDADQFTQGIADQGYGPVGKKKIAALAAGSMLLSGGFLNAARGAYNYINYSMTDMMPLELFWGGIYASWPEFTLGFNDDNASMNTVVEIRYIPFYFKLGCDVPVLGNTDGPGEPTVGAEIRYWRFRPRVELSYAFNGIPFIMGELAVFFTETFAAGVEGMYGHGNTMREWREYPQGNGAIGFVRIFLK